ncbi:hypothetical protein M409DRAFT_70326 [Zasmidium cellare ATCC 36951]|uniref:Survival protein SurE-like phosphatase/nucleotidase domain-containing protein n=1 Tax=Zasmidium cellare ATCC 36951 TaxID=1080233 RepID=A0A6A6C136_ZASCE|nr:uncharacterized protein M409DRAFT_70326 [Zasmidium cellare ATCC 36951]KAF2160573.1 hypothetical protein M409DRAFT_70326 [Zasmidium cellare ATCC 36951]
MKFSAFLVLPVAAQAINIVISNDDGWAEINIRELYNCLTRAGFNGLISAPAENKSGTGSSDEEPEEVGEDGCEFASCPAGSPPYGKSESEPRFNYVNSYPVTSMRYGIQNLSTTFFQGPPDIAVAGFNVGTNLGIVTSISGTVGAAVEAVKEGVPAIAFSGSTGHQTAWNAPLQPYMTIYADLSANVTQTLTSSGKPYLPEDVFVNVNFPAVNDRCHSTSSFKFVFSRIYPAVPVFTPDDVETCGSKRLPVERSVVKNTAGCFASISVGNTDKVDVDAELQAAVLEKLKGILSCLPEDEKDARKMVL